MSTFTSDNEYVLKHAVICEGRQVSVICHAEAVLEGFPCAHGPLRLQYFFLGGRINYIIYIFVERVVIQMTTRV